MDDKLEFENVCYMEMYNIIYIVMMFNYVTNDVGSSSVYIYSYIK